METRGCGEPAGLPRATEANLRAAVPSAERSGSSKGAMASDVDLIAALPWKRASQANGFRTADAGEPHKPPTEIRQPFVQQAGGVQPAARVPIPLAFPRIVVGLTGNGG